MSDPPVPEHKLLESPNSRTIQINGWSITASTNPISNAFELDELHSYLAIPMPEMTFGRNFLSLQHLPTAWNYSFTAGNALQAVKKGELEDGDGGVKVGYADAWLKSR
jgi:type 2A phosphatase activator TIP41